MGDRVVIKCDKLEYAIPQEAQCVVGTNSIHPLRAMHIGTYYLPYLLNLFCDKSVVSDKRDSVSEIFSPVVFSLKSLI